MLSKKAPANFSTALYFLLPFMEQTGQYMQFSGSTQGSQFCPKNNPTAQAPPILICPSDGSNNYKPGLMPWNATTDLGIASYTINIQALGHYWCASVTPTARCQVGYNKRRRIPRDFPDGTSKTLVFTERYQVCPNEGDGRNAWLGTYAYLSGVNRWNPFFADSNINTFKLQEPLTFPQDAPKQIDCNPLTVQSGHRGALQFVAADGSVRSLNPSSIVYRIWKAVVVPNDGTTFTSQDL
jgi:hypothetical protein